MYLLFMLLINSSFYFNAYLQTFDMNFRYLNTESHMVWD